MSWNNDVTLTQLRYFLAVIKAGSISGAAVQIHVAQPALSQRLKQLETELGQRLFTRLPRGIELTAAGHKLKIHALEIIRRVESVHTDFVSSDSNPFGHVKLGMSTAINTKFCVDVLESVNRIYPNIQLALVESMSGTLLEWTESGRIDMAVVYDTPGNTPLVVNFLAREKLYLVSNREAKGALPDVITIAEIAELDLILPAFPQTLRLMIEKVFLDSIGKSPKILIDVDSTHAIKKLVAAGKGHSILSIHSIDDELSRQELAITPIADPSITRTINLVSNQNRTPDSAVRAVQKVVTRLLAARLSDGGEDRPDYVV
ncbi:hypothetical protein CR159_07245 [Pollutimonas subterranea]|uniref:HTH lysR-type domain-containing protein n=1 Tax=Pollutimonas subterranea TaxID=2045210 RepID=A0A2N4U6Z0_9BURK|nr:hypothetical protein CR159_07245 [Pollutimonas subterranea]